MILTFKDYMINGTPQEIKEFIEIYETQTTLSTDLSGYLYEPRNPKQVICPHCYSNRVTSLYERMNLDGSNVRKHYICENCHNEFEV